MLCIFQSLARRTELIKLRRFGPSRTSRRGKGADSLEVELSIGLNGTKCSQTFMPTQYNRKYVKPASLASLCTNLECGSGCISLSQPDQVWESSNLAWAELDQLERNTWKITNTLYAAFKALCKQQIPAHKRMYCPVTDSRIITYKVFLFYSYYCLHLHLFVPLTTLR